LSRVVAGGAVPENEEPYYNRRRAENLVLSFG
jgi:hypothetical protein